MSLLQVFFPTVRSRPRSSFSKVNTNCTPQIKYSINNGAGTVPSPGSSRDCAAASGSAPRDSHNKGAQQDHMRLGTVLTKSIKMNSNVIFVIGLKSGAKKLKHLGVLSPEYRKRAVHFYASGFPFLNKIIGLKYSSKSHKKPCAGF